RCNQVHNGRPGAQEDLAVAIGSDKAHICRIERGYQLPERETLIRVCSALGLDHAETNFMLQLGGYAAAAAPLKLENDDRYLHDLKLELEAIFHPALLVDALTRLRYVNSGTLFLFGRGCGQDQARAFY